MGSARKLAAGSRDQLPNLIRNFWALPCWGPYSNILISLQIISCIICRPQRTNFLVCSSMSLIDTSSNSSLCKKNKKRKKKKTLMLSSPHLTWSGLILRIPASAPFFFSVLVLLTCTFWQLLIKSWLPPGDDMFVTEKQHGLPGPHVRSSAVLLNTVPFKTGYGFSEVMLFIRKSHFI